MEKGEASRSFSALGGWKGLKYSVRDSMSLNNVLNRLKSLEIILLISSHKMHEVKLIISTFRSKHKEKPIR